MIKILLTIMIVSIMTIQDVMAIQNNNTTDINNNITGNITGIDNNITGNITGIDNNITDINHTLLSINMKNLGLDKNFNVYRLIINITTYSIGNITYNENYYTVDSQGNPKLYSSGRYYDDKLIDKTVSFDISRPRSRPGKDYSLIKSIVMFNNVVIFEDWIPIDRSYRFDNKNKPQKIERPVMVTEINKTDKITFLEQYNNNSLELSELPIIFPIESDKGIPKLEKIIATIMIIFIVYVSIRMKI